MVLPKEGLHQSFGEFGPKLRPLSNPQAHVAHVYEFKHRSRDIKINS